MADHEDYSSPIKTPRQLVTVIVLAFLVPTLVIVLLVQFVVGAKGGGSGTAAATPEAITARLRPVAAVTLAAAGGAAHALLGGEAVYKQVCTTCHAAGLAGSPKLGDKAAWDPRIKEGLATLVTHAVQGYKAMPAKGGAAALDPTEVARAVAWMADQAGASFKEPDAPPQ